MPPSSTQERDILEDSEGALIFIAAAYAVDVEAAELLVTILGAGLFSQTEGQQPIPA